MGLDIKFRFADCRTGKLMYWLAGWLVMELVDRRAGWCVVWVIGIFLYK